MTRKRIVFIAAIVVVLPALFVADQAARTLRTLTVVERERDTWQRPEEILRHLDLGPGKAVVDLGSGAGYFSLKIAPRVAPDRRSVRDRSPPSVAGISLDSRCARAAFESAHHPRTGGQSDAATDSD